MLRCRDIADRADAYLDGQLSFRERMQVRLHVLLCKPCRAFLRQFSLTIGALRAMGGDREPNAAVDDTVRRILTAIPRPAPDDEDVRRVGANVVIYTTAWCLYCRRAKALLDRKRVTYREIDVGGDAARRQEMIARSGGAVTVPQIFIGGRCVGGCDELQALERAGQLDPLLAR